VQHDLGPAVVAVVEVLVGVEEIPKAVARLAKGGGRGKTVAAIAGAGGD
jgi:NADPH-dependent curcumin reductase CurA